MEADVFLAMGDYNEVEVLRSRNELRDDMEEMFILLRLSYK
jgi:hypothetical protein